MLNNLVRDRGIEWAYHDLGDLYKKQGKLVDAEQTYQLALQRYFTSMPLFTELQACEFSAMGTPCPHKELQTRFKVLQTQFATKLE